MVQARKSPASAATLAGLEEGLRVQASTRKEEQKAYEYARSTHSTA